MDKNEAKRLHGISSEEILFLSMLFTVATFVSDRELIKYTALATVVWAVTVFTIEKIIKERLS